MRFIFAIGCAFFTLSLSSPVMGHEGYHPSSGQDTPFSYDTMDSTDVLAIPSDSSAWEQEAEIQELQDEENEIQHKNNRAGH